MANGGRRADPYGRHRFIVDLDGIIVGGVNEIRGLSKPVDSDGAAGGLSGVDPLSGGADGTLKLRQGVTDETALWNWLQEWADGNGEERRLRVGLLDGDAELSRGWECTGVRPIGWEGPTLTADTPGVAMETYELAYETIRDWEP